MLFLCTIGPLILIVNFRSVLLRSPCFFLLRDLLWHGYGPSHPDSVRQHSFRGRSLERRARGRLARRWVAWMGGRGVEEREEVALWVEEALEIWAE